MLRAFIFAILIFSCCNIWAQDEYFRHIDSLRMMAENSDDERADTLYMEVGRAYAYNKPAQAINYLSLSVELAERTHDNKVLCMAYSFMGIAYSQMGSYAKSVEFFNKQLNIAKELNMMDEVAWANSNIGQVLLQLKNYDIANIYLNDANDMAEIINDDYMKQYVYSNMGWLKLCLQEYDQSLDFYNKALAIRLQSPNDSVNLAANYRDIGNVYFDKGDFISAKHYYALSQSFTSSVNISLLAPIMVNLSTIFMKTGNLDSARVCIQSALDIAGHVGETATIRDAYGIYGNIYYAMGQYAKAEKCFSLQMAYHDSVNLSEVSKKIYELQYHRNIEGQKIERLTAEMHTRTIISLSLSIALLLVAGVFLALRLRRKRATIQAMNSELAKHNMQTNESIAYARRIQRAVMPNFENLGHFMDDKFMLFKPKHAVSGTFFWSHSAANIEMFAVCDTGETGIPGSCISMLGSSVLHDIAQTHTDPADILDLFRSRVVDVLHSVTHDGDRGSDADISLMVTNPDTSRLYYSGVKFPLLVVRGGQLILLQDNLEHHQFYTKKFVTSHIDIQHGDSIYMMTHGICLQTNSNGEILSRESVCACILENSSLPMHQQSLMLEQLMNTWRGAEPQLCDIMVAGGKYINNTKQ